MASLGSYPVNLVVSGKRCVVIGAGRIAARKIENLVSQGADVTVISPQVCTEVRGWANEGSIEIIERAFRPDDLNNAWLAVTATDNPAVNHAVHEEGEKRRVWVNSADDPDNCSFTLMSVVRRGDLAIAIGTAGRSPALARRTRQQIAQDFGPEMETVLELLSERREEIRDTGRSSEDADWDSVFTNGIVELVQAGELDKARALLAEL